MPKPFEELLHDPKKFQQVLAGFTKAIRQSYTTHAVAHETHAETKRRYLICEKWFRILRGDKQWSVDRALDGAIRALASELSGVDYVPMERSLWLPGD